MFHPVHSPRYQHSGFISITRGFAIFPHDKKVYQYAAHHFTLARGFAYSLHFIHADYDTPIFGVTWFIHNTTFRGTPHICASVALYVRFLGSLT